MCLTYASCVWAARPLQMFVNSSIHLPRQRRRRQRDDDAISQKIQQVKSQRLSKEIKYVRRGKNQKAITCEQKNKNNTKSRVKRAERREREECRARDNKHNSRLIDPRFKVQIGCLTVNRQTNKQTNKHVEPQVPRPHSELTPKSTLANLK